MSPAQHALHFTPEALAFLFESHGVEVIDCWHSHANEYPPKALPGYERLLSDMARLGVHCEFTLLGRKP
jgi:hypothetical protein